MGVQTTSSSQDPEQGGSVTSRPLNARGLLHLVSVELTGRLWAPMQGAHRQCTASRPLLSYVSSVLSRSVGSLSRVDVKWTGSVPARSTFEFFTFSLFLPFNLSPSLPSQLMREKMQKFGPWIDCHSECYRLEAREGACARCESVA